GVVVEALEARQRARLRAGLRPLRCGMPGGEVTEQIPFARLQQSTSGARQPFAEQTQIAPVGFERVLRQTVLQPKLIAEGVEQRGVGLAQSSGLASHPSCRNS